MAPLAAPHEEKWKDIVAESDANVLVLSKSLDKTIQDKMAYGGAGWSIASCSYYNLSAMIFFAEKANMAVTWLADRTRE